MADDSSQDEAPQAEVEEAVAAEEEGVVEEEAVEEEPAATYNEVGAARARSRLQAQRRGGRVCFRPRPPLPLHLAPTSVPPAAL